MFLAKVKAMHKFEDFKKDELSSFFPNCWKKNLFLEKNGKGGAIDIAENFGFPIIFPDIFPIGIQLKSLLRAHTFVFLLLIFVSIVSVTVTTISVCSIHMSGIVM